MKNPFRLFLISAAISLLIPSAILLPHLKPAQMPQDSTEKTIEDTRYYSVYITAEHIVRQVSVRSYLIGAVAAEMPASYAFDALCAQCIASHTYAERMRHDNILHPDSGISGADFSDDPEAYQAFYSTDQLRKLWGDCYEENYKKITDAVDAVGDLVLYYDNAPIAAAFHACSAGKTESAKTVWGTDLPYLRSVLSADDVQFPQYETVVSFTPDTFSAAVQAVRQDITFPSDPSKWIGASELSDAGTVLKIGIGSGWMTGAELRAALALRSACFTMQYQADAHAFICTVHGSGHLVGMSQFGAHRMALSGASYDEILLHYYPETELRAV